jgi:hypothetical protein
MSKKELLFINKHELETYLKQKSDYSLMYIHGYNKDDIEISTSIINQMSIVNNLDEDNIANLIPIFDEKKIKSNLYRMIILESDPRLCNNIENSNIANKIREYANDCNLIVIISEKNYTSLTSFLITILDSCDLFVINTEIDIFHNEQLITCYKKCFNIVIILLVLMTICDYIIRFISSY